MTISGKDETCAVMGWIGPAGPTRGTALARSTALWMKALSPEKDSLAAAPPLERPALAEQPALAFRGILSFWTSGKVPDDALRAKAYAVTTVLMAGSVQARPG